MRINTVVIRQIYKDKNKPINIDIIKFKGKDSSVYFSILRDKNDNHVFNGDVVKLSPKYKTSQINKMLNNEDSAIGILTLNNSHLYFQRKEDYLTSNKIYFDRPLDSDEVENLVNLEEFGCTLGNRVLEFK